MTLRNEDQLIDFAYDRFLEQAQHKLAPADQILFAMQFDDRGAVDIVPFHINDWPGVINMGTNPNEYSALHIGLLDEHEELTDIFAQVLIKKQLNNSFIHILWKQE